MSKYKVSVYAICKNEEKFVSRWVESMKEADEIYVLDTGSTDNTIKKLGVNVTRRKEFGTDIDAACGQLRAKKLGVLKDE